MRLFLQENRYFVFLFQWINYALPPGFIIGFSRRILKTINVIILLALVIKASHNFNVNKILPLKITIISILRILARFIEL